MKNNRVYVDTSVFGGVFDPEFEKESKQFFEEIKLGLFIPFVSPIVRREILNAPSDVRKYYEKMLSYSEMIDITDDALKLMEAYIQAGILSPKSSDDALHVAIASINRCDKIVSWNFRHIVHSDKIRFYHAVNLMHGYDRIEIFSPREVIHYDEDV
ncbi:type II toxin-antitoxin system VapC family toxin [bacterium]|nr:type II toxin-antitoxin system VapC family toxin [bacterium]